MRIIYLSILAILYLSPFQAVSAQEASQRKTQKQQKEQIVAEVNDTQITKTQLEQELQRQLGDELQNFKESDRHFLSRQLLEKMIEREMLMQAAAKDKLIPSKKEVDSFIAQINEQLRSENGLKKELQKYGLAENDFRAGLREDLAIRAYLDRHVFADLNISEAETKKEFDENVERYTKPEEVRVRHILFKVDKSANSEDVNAAQKRAVKFLEEVRESGAVIDFPALAKKHSEASNSAKGGDLGFITRDQLDPEFTKAAFALKKGEISEPVRSSYGFHIIKLEEKRAAEKADFSKLKEKISAQLLRKKREQLLAAHVKTLRKSYKVIVYFR